MEFIEIITSIGMVVSVSLVVLDYVLYSDSIFERIVWAFTLFGILTCLVCYLIKVV